MKKPTLQMLFSVLLSVNLVNSLVFRVFDLNVWGTTPFDEDPPSAEELKDFKSFVGDFVRKVTGSGRISPLLLFSLTEYLARNKRQRLKEIAEHIRKSDYDVVTLQEIFYKQDHEYLVNALRGDYYASPFYECGIGRSPYGPKLLPTGCHGLMTLTKKKFALTGIQYFDSKVDVGDSNSILQLLPEYLLSRGVLITWFKIDGIKFQIMNAHLVSSWDWEDSTNKNARAAQAYQILDNLDEKAVDFVVIAGDMNSNSDPFENPPTLKPFQIFTEAGFVDGQTESASGCKNSICPPVQYTYNSRRNSYYQSEYPSQLLDYVMYKNLNKEELKIDMILCSTLTKSYNFSDHEALFLNLDIKHLK